MKFLPTSIDGAYVVEIEPAGDSRGFFARTFCAREFAEQGLETVFVQSSVALNRQALTLRGLHFQSQPHPEVKLVSCRAGKLYDVIADLRPHSPTRGRWFAVELSAENKRSLYVPGDCAHGFLTLVDDTEVQYHMNSYYVPELARGVHWNDPDLAIAWPEAPRHLSDRDRTLPPLSEVLADVAASRRRAGLDDEQSPLGGLGVGK